MGPYCHQEKSRSGNLSAEQNSRMKIVGLRRRRFHKLGAQWVPSDGATRYTMYAIKKMQTAEEMLLLLMLGCVNIWRKRFKSADNSICLGLGPLGQDA